ncbi:MAG: hypothetical protein U1F56_13880 [Rubrivivax sp.]
MFGYEEGAFTGARRKGSGQDRAGRRRHAVPRRDRRHADRAAGAPLRVLQERQVTPLGSTKSVRWTSTSSAPRTAPARDDRGQDLPRGPVHRLTGLAVGCCASAAT